MPSVGESVHVDQHTTVRFDGSNSTDNVGVANWTWWFDYEGELHRLYGPTPSFTFHEAGEYLVTLRVSDPTGNWATATVGVTVVDTTPPVAIVGDDIVIDQGEVFTLDGTASTDNVEVASWTWTFVHDGENISLDGAEIEYVLDVVGMYEVTLTVGDRVGNKASDTLTVTVLDATAPMAEAGDDIELGTGEQVTFDGSASSDNVGIASWNWTFEYQGSGETLSGETTSFTFDLPGVYVVTLEVRDVSGLTAIDTTTVTVRDLTPPVADAGEDVEVGQGVEVTFDGSGSSDNVGVLYWNWTVEVGGSKVAKEGKEVKYTFDVPGVYTVTLTVEDAAGNRASDEVVVTVLDTEPPVAVTRGDAEIEANTSLAMDGSNSTDNVGIVSYEWSLDGPDGISSLQGSEVVHSFVTPGTYTVTLVVIDGAGNSGETSFRVVVTPVEDDNGNGGGGDGTFEWLYVVIALAVVALVLAAVMVVMRRR